MKTYRRGALQGFNPQQSGSLNGEFQRVKDALERPVPDLTWEYRHSEPDKIIPGMEVIADGVDWDPGGIGVAGKYRRSEDNTTWELIEATAVSISLSTRISSLSTSASTGIGSLSTGVVSLSTSTSTTATSLSTGISSLSTSASTRVGSLSTSIASLSTSASTGIGSLSTGLSTTNSGVTSLSTGLSTTNSSLTSLSTSSSSGIASVSTGVSSLSTSLSSTNSSVTSLSTSTSTGIKSLSTGISSLSTSASTGITSLSTSASTGVGSLSTGLSTTNASKFVVQGTAASSLTAAQFLGALATGIVKNTTTTGVLSIAVAADFPTLNQNTTGSAASLSVSGQTGLITFTGITSTSRAKTVRDAADTFLELGGSYTPTGTWTSMTLVTPALGTPTSGTLTNCTGLPVSSGISGLGTGVATFLGTPSSANLAAAVTDELGSTKLVFGSTGSFTATATGMTTSPTGTISYVMLGSLVFCTLGATITGTSNATTFTLTGAPSAIWPSASVIFVMRVQDNGGSVVYGRGVMDTSGVITLSKDAAGTAFTNTGTKSVQPICFFYST